MSSFTIESIIKRPGGTKGVTIGDESYDFLPNKAGAHICVVTNPEHAQRFLGIVEGYRIYVPEGEKAPAAPATGVGVKPEAANPPAAPTPPAGPTPPAQEAAASVEQTNQAPTDPVQSEPASDKPLADLGSDELRKVYAEEVGRAAHHKAKDETLIATIEAVRKEKAGAA